MNASDICEMVAQAQLMRESIEKDWIENIQFLMGNHGMRTALDDVDPVQVNMAWANMMAVIPTLYWRNPNVIARPKRPQDAQGAPVLEAGIQHWMGLIGVQRVVQRVIVDAHCMSFGLTKLGFRVKDVQVAVRVNKRTGDYDVVDESEEVDLSEFDVEQRTLLRGERPMFSRVSLLNAWIDPLSADFEESEWLYHEIVRNSDDVIHDSKYSNTSKITPTGAVDDIFAVRGTPPRQRPSISPDQGPNASSIYGSGRLRENQLVIGELWHKPSRKLYVVVPHQQLLIREDDWPYPFFPFRAMHLGVPAPDTPYPIPPNSAWKPQQIELNNLRTYTLDHIKREIPKHLVDKNKVDEDSEQDLREGLQQVVFVDGDPNTAHATMPGHPVSGDVWRAESAIKSDIDNISGTPEYQRGAALPDATATEIRAISGATQARIEYQRFQVGDVVKWCATGMHKLLRIYWDKPEWIRVTGRSDWEYRKLDAAALDGEYEIDIEVGSQLMPDKDLEKKRSMDQFSILAPIAVQRPDLLKFDELVRWLMEQMEVPNPDRFLQGDDINKPPSNVEDEEMLLAMGGVPAFSPNDNHAQHIPRHLKGVMEAKDDTERWRRLLHLKKHLDYEQQQMLASQMAQSGMLQQMGGGMGGPPPGPGGPGPKNIVPMQAGQGRASVEPGYPIQPRLFARGPGDTTTQSRVDSRRLR